MKKIIKTLLVVMVLAVVLTAFTGCDAVETLKGIIPPTIAEKIPPQLTCSILGHKSAGPSNCTEDEVCARCYAVITEASGHDIVVDALVKSTCTEPGKTEGSHCTKCDGATVPQREVPAKGHKYVDGVCSVCEYEHDHEYVETVVPTTCTEGGYTLHECSCGLYYITDEVEVDPTAHSFVSIPWGNYSVYGYCALCEAFEYGVGSFTRNVTADFGVDQLGGFYEFVFIYITEAGHYTIDGGSTVAASVWSYSAGTQIGTWGNAWLEPGFYILGLNYYGGVGEYTITVAKGECTNTDEITQEPTCTETGLKTTTCTVCGHVVEGVEVPVIAHDYKDGYCSCGAVDPDYYFTVTIPEALEKVDGSKVIVSGTVVGIYQAYNSQFNNTSVYVADAEGNKILLFRVPGNWSIGDKLTVKGTISIYKGTAQVAQGSTVVEYTDVTRVYLSNAAGWTQPYFYTWEPEVAGWPGAKMSLDEELGLWYYDVPAANVNVIFNNGSGTQTGNLTMPTDSKVVYDNKAAYWGIIGEEFDYSVKFTVAGESGLCGSNWDITDTDNDMTYDEATETYTKVYTNIAAGTYKFKCVKEHSWDVAYPSSDYVLNVAKDGSTVVITLKGTTVSVEVKDPSETSFKLQATIGGTVYYWNGSASSGKGVLTTDASAAVSLKVEDAGNGYSYVYYVNGSGEKVYIYITDGNTGFKTSTTASKVKYDASTGYIYEDSFTDARYVATYGTQDIRTYKTTNIPGSSNNAYMIMVAN